MQVYMVERSLKGIAMDALAAAQQRAIETSKQTSQAGTPVRCMCLFAAESAEDVRRVNEKAQIPFDRIVPAMDLTPA
jgi:acyl-CoA synthetase (NDP forming)